MKSETKSKILAASIEESKLAQAEEEILAKCPTHRIKYVA